MKKIYAFLAAALLSVSMFAAPDKVPTKADLDAAGYNTADNVVVCLYFDEEVCNDIVFVGNHALKDAEDPNSGWSEDPNVVPHMQELPGFEGWYVVEVEAAEGRQGKPVQLKSDGTFSWDFQSGDVDAWIPMAETESAEISAGFSDEANVAYPAAGAYIYEIAYFKKHNSPCVYVPKFKYTIILLDPYCEGSDFAPAIIGSFNNWSEGVAMAETTYEGELAFSYVLEDEAGHEFKFREVKDVDWTNQLQGYDEETGTWSNLDNNSLPEVTKDTTLVFDFSDLTKYRYSLCGADDSEYSVFVTFKAPAGAPAAGVEILGSFSNWDESPVVMEAGADNVYTATVTAKESGEFKFREAGTWDNQIITVADGKELDNMRFGDLWEDAEGGKAVTLDFSNAEVYAWKANYTGLENISFEAIEGVRKVVIDGNLYIQKGNAIYNVMGAQVR